ncbi:MAG: F0F1 ATP synthase subunit epsilon [Chromatiales bacterium]|nr:F0F1 ATP synthase subunit epsilon [Chromatiales bacterium]
MTMTIHVDIVSAESQVYSGQAQMVIAPAEMGDVGVAPRHTPLLTRLRPGEVKVIPESGDTMYFYVSGGILEIQPHVVTVLTDTGVRSKDLNEAAALKAKEQAEQALANRQGEFEYAKAKAELAEAVAQLRAIQRIRQGGRGS